MEHVGRWGLLAVALGVMMAAACSRAVPGTPSAVAGSAAALPYAVGPPAAHSDAAGPSASGAPSASATRAQAPILEPDVLADECLLDTAQLGALLGRPARAEQSVVQRTDGTRSASCYAAAVDGPRAPSAAINVYRVRSGTPAEFVQVAGGRALAGAGGAATLLETAAGPTLQVAGPAYLVTLVVQGRSPPDDAWRAAARAALGRLPG